MHAFQVFSANHFRQMQAENPNAQQPPVETMLEAARVAGLNVGSLNLKVIDRWYETGWYDLFKKRCGTTTVGHHRMAELTELHQVSRRPEDGSASTLLRSPRPTGGSRTFLWTARYDGSPFNDPPAAHGRALGTPQSRCALPALRGKLATVVRVPAVAFSNGTEHRASAIVPVSAIVRQYLNA